MTDSQRREFLRSGIRHALQKSEAVRIGVVAVLTIVVGVSVTYRHYAGGVLMQGAVFPATIALVAASFAWTVANWVIVRKYCKRGALLPEWFWIVSVIVESLLPSGAILFYTTLSHVDAYRASTPPALLVYGILAVVSVLRLRPALSVLGGIVSALSHAGLVGLAMWESGEMSPALAVTLHAYSLLVLLAWLAAAVVAHELRNHVLAAVREATTRAELAEIHSEMAAANAIQRRLMPAAPLRLAEYEVCGWNRPASTTGGDYYDWMPLDEHRVAVAIADVTGHGIGPALLMAVCRAYARATLPGQAQLVGGLQKLNTLLTDDLGGERFITFAVAIFDRRTHEVELLSAGHGPLLLCRVANDHVDIFGGDGLPLGIMPDPGFDAPRQFTFAPGDMLVLVTDGFTEAANPATGEMYGTERLRTFLVANRALAGEAILDRLAADVTAFTNGATQADDMTAVLIRRTTKA